MPTWTEEFSADRGRHPTVRVGRYGYEGTRYFRIDSSDASIALATPGLPARGDPWPGITGTFVDQIYLASPGGVNYYADVSYLPPASPESGGGGGTSLPYSRIQPAVRSETIPKVATGVNAGLPYTAQVQIPHAELRVSVRTQSATGLQTYLNSVIGRVNSNAIGVPSVRGFSGFSFTVQPRQLIALAPVIEEESDTSCRIIYVFGLGPAGWMDVSVVPTRADGTLGSETKERVYPEVAFPVLW